MGRSDVLHGSLDLPLPYAEQKLPISAMDVSVKRVVGGWQVWAGQRMMRDLGDSDQVHGVVEPPVPALVEPMPDSRSGGRFDRGGAVVAGEAIT